MTQSHSTTENKHPTIVVIDDDRDIREALEGLLRSVGLHVATFSSVQEYLNNGPAQSPDCLVLDVRLPGQSGPDFFDQLVRNRNVVPVIFISGHADVPMSVRAMKAGAFEFLTKPVRHQDLLDAIQLAIKQSRTRREEETTVSAARADFDTLTAREREVMAMVVAGSLNKQIAAKIGISLATVKLHRGQLMRKMRVRSLADLVRLAEKIEATR